MTDKVYPQNGEAGIDVVDYFAGQALMALIQKSQEEGAADIKESEKSEVIAYYRAIARTAYKIGAEMERIRNNRQSKG